MSTLMVRCYLNSRNNETVQQTIAAYTEVLDISKDSHHPMTFLNARIPIYGWMNTQEFNIFEAAGVHGDITGLTIYGYNDYMCNPEFISKSKSWANPTMHNAEIKCNIIFELDTQTISCIDVPAIQNQYKQVIDTMSALNPDSAIKITVMDDLIFRLKNNGDISFSQESRNPFMRGIYVECRISHREEDTV